MLEPARNLLKRLWERWKIFAHVVGNFQARVILTLFYLLLVPPFALIVKLAKDPLSLRAAHRSTYWLTRPTPQEPGSAGRQQF